VDKEEEKGRERKGGEGKEGRRGGREGMEVLGRGRGSNGGKAEGGITILRYALSWL